MLDMGVVLNGVPNPVEGLDNRSVGSTDIALSICSLHSTLKLLIYYFLQPVQ